MQSNLLQQLIELGSATPKRDNKVLFIGRSDGQFTGNVKYLFLHFVQHAPDLHPVYITSNAETKRVLETAGLPVRLFPEAEALRDAAEAGTVIVDDFHYKESPIALLIRGARVIQLWHGVGFKKVGFLEADSSLDLSAERRQELRHLYSGYHSVISTSPFYTENLFQTSFGAEHIWETGYPRNDIFFRKPTKYDMLQAAPKVYGKVRQLAKSKTIALYVPTFRDDGSNPLADGALNFTALDVFLGKLDTILVIKMHTFSGTLPELPFQNILVFPSDEDVYPLMPLTDYMITDYSSIYTDYLTMNKPVLFFPYDWEEYVSKNRELQFDYEWITPGPKLKTADELMMAMKLFSAGTGADSYAEKRAEIGQLAFARHDGESSARVLAHLRAELSS